MEPPAVYPDARRCAKPAARTIGDNGKIIKEIPFSDHLTFKDANGTAVGQMAILAAPTAGDYAIRLDPVPGAPAGQSA